MFTAILSLFGSSAFGSLVGWVGGAINRWMDLKGKQIDYKFELDKMEKEREYMREEYAQRANITSIETEGRIEEAGYEAMVAAYKADRATYGIKWVDAFRGIIRPLLTLLFFVFSCVVFAIVADYVSKSGVPFTAAQYFELFQRVIEWVLFQAAVCVGFWFANRPTRQPKH